MKTNNLFKKINKFFEKHEKRFRYSILLALYLLIALSLGVIPVKMIIPILAISIGSVVILKQIL